MQRPLALRGGSKFSQKLKPQRLILHQDRDFLSCTDPFWGVSVKEYIYMYYQFENNQAHNLNHLPVLVGGLGPLWQIAWRGAAENTRTQVGLGDKYIHIYIYIYIYI